MKQLVVMVLLAQLLFSCKSYQSITKTEKINKDFLSRLEPGKKYMFELRSGLRPIVEVMHVAHDTITGNIYQDDASGKRTKSSYSGSFESIEKDVVKISVRKNNPYLTTAAIVVGAASVTFLALAFAVAYGY